MSITTSLERREHPSGVMSRLVTQYFRYEAEVAGIGDVRILARYRGSLRRFLIVGLSLLLKIREAFIITSS